MKLLDFVKLIMDQITHKRLRYRHSCYTFNCDIDIYCLTKYFHLLIRIQYDDLFSSVLLVFILLSVNKTLIISLDIASLSKTYKVLQNIISTFITTVL